MDVKELQNDRNDTMKKGYIIYGAIAVFFLFAVYILTISEVTIKLEKTHLAEVDELAKENKDFTEYIKYHYEYYDNIWEQETEDYYFFFYHVVASNDKNALFGIVLPTGNIKIANNANDSNDKTNIKLFSDNENNDKLDLADAEIALSYGYNSDKIGYMFFNVMIVENTEYLFEYVDYDGITILTDTILVTVANHDDQRLESGYTLDEKKTILNLDAEVKSAMIKRVTIYLIIVVAMPFIYELIKRLLLKKGKRIQ